MKNAIISLCLLLIVHLVPAQNVGIGTTTPNASAQLEISSTSKGLLIPRLTTTQRMAIALPAKGLMVYDSDLKNFWFYDSVWSVVGVDNANYWNLVANNISNNNAGNVGIGIASPAYKLDVYGSLHSYDGYFDGYVGIGTTSPAYKLQINDGSIAVYNTTDAKVWSMNYNSSGNYFQLLESGVTRLVIANGGNMGIGTSTPAYKLDVAGAIRATGNIESNSALVVAGTATVNSGKGVAYNLGAATNLKMAPFTTAYFHAVLAGNAMSGELTIALPAGFTSAPRVFVGDIDLTGGIGGDLYRVQLIVYGCTATSCKARLLNTSPYAVDYSTSWNMLAVGY